MSQFIHQSAQTTQTRPDPKTSAIAAPTSGNMRYVLADNFISVWETGCKTSTSTINKTMDKNNEYNKVHTPKERESIHQQREREREGEREHVVKYNNIFITWQH